MLPTSCHGTCRRNHAGRRNEPALLAHIAAVVAELPGHAHRPELGQVTTSANARRLFGLA